MGLVVTVASALTVGSALGKGVSAPEAGVAALPAVAVSQLPAGAQTTYRLIRVGGPFESRKDGSVFGNRERELPRRARGFYREYTVATPGARNRGARRIVCGGNTPTEPEACYYTGDPLCEFQSDRTVSPRSTFWF